MLNSHEILPWLLSFPGVGQGAALKWRPAAENVGMTLSQNASQHHLWKTSKAREEGEEGSVGRSEGTQQRDLCMEEAAPREQGHAHKIRGHGRVGELSAFCSQPALASHQPRCPTPPPH